jgi:hypothetical protein
MARTDTIPAMFFGFMQYGLLGIGLIGLALIHYMRKRPDGYWIYIILFLGPIGALIYLAVEAAPELGDPGAFKFLDRRKRIRILESAIHDNPSAGNFEELGQLHLDAGHWKVAKECFDRSITKRTDSVDPFYRRSIAEIEMGDFSAARADLERVIAKDRGYDFHRALGLYAYALAKTGDSAAAEKAFQDALRISTLTETQLHYAEFLQNQGHKDEAREVGQRILNKRASMPGFLKRRERPLFRQTKSLLRSL